MPFLPFQSEILVSVLTKDEVLIRLDKVTRNVNFLDLEARKVDGFLFNGTLSTDSFRVSLVIDKADSFLPLIKGKIEDSGNGTILFLEYSLFPASIFFLVFWSLVTISLFFFFGLIAGKPLYALVSLALGLGNYFFAWSYFKKKTKISQEIFHRLLQ